MWPATMVLLLPQRLGDECCSCLSQAQWNSVCTGKLNFAAYTCNHPADTCEAPTKEADYDAYDNLLTCATDDCTTRTQQSTYNAFSTSGAGIGLWPINQVLDVSTSDGGDPTQHAYGSFAFNGCDARRLQYRVAYDNGSGGTNLSSWSPFGSLLHYWDDQTIITSGTALNPAPWFGREVFYIEVEFLSPGGTRPATPITAYDLKGSFQYGSFP